MEAIIIGIIGFSFAAIILALTLFIVFGVYYILKDWWEHGGLN